MTEHALGGSFTLTHVVMIDERPLFEHPPAFLAGTFAWTPRGYRYAQEPDVDLMAAEALAADNPWIVLAAVLERAKRGDFASVSAVSRWATAEHAERSWAGACLGLIACAGDAKALEWLALELLERTGYACIQLAQAAQWSGQLMMVPFLVEARNRLSRYADREAVDVCLSGLLEPWDGEFELFDGTRSPAEYERVALARRDALVARHGSDRIALLRGEPVDVWKMLGDMQRQLGGSPAASFCHAWRHTFETYTGVDCSKFYDRGRFLPNNALVGLAKYAAREPRVDFQPGQRYFFGHRVPY